MISEREWASIGALITKITGKANKRQFITGKVVKNNTGNKTVWLKELGAQAIPVVGFDYDVKYYDTDSTGTVNVRHMTATPKTPKVGQIVVVALELGDQSIPRCIGVVQGKNWITSEEN
jgi:hypothetical protein